MDVNSGSIHVVDDVVSDIIPLVEELAGKSVKDPVALKEALLRRTDLPYPEEILTEALEEVLELEAAVCP